MVYINRSNACYDKGATIRIFSEAPRLRTPILLVSHYYFLYVTHLLILTKLGSTALTQSHDPLRYLS